MNWWQSWVMAGMLAIVAPWPWNIILAAPFAAWAGWMLVPRTSTCGWCGRSFVGDDWCCDVCASNPDALP